LYSIKDTQFRCHFQTLNICYQHVIHSTAAVVYRRSFGESFVSKTRYIPQKQASVVSANEAVSHSTRFHFPSFFSYRSFSKQKNLLPHNWQLAGGYEL